MLRSVYNASPCTRTHARIAAIWSAVGKAASRAGPTRRRSMPTERVSTTCGSMSAGSRVVDTLTLQVPACWSRPLLFPPGWLGDGRGRRGGASWSTSRCTLTARAMRKKSAFSTILSLRGSLPSGATAALPAALRDTSASKDAMV